MTIEDIADEWTKYNGIILFRPRPGSPMPQQIAVNATQVGAYEMLSLQMRLFEDISGVHGAIQGKAAQSGTPASLYAQQIQYSSTNLLDLFESFKTFREDRDIKIMKTIQQFYSDNRYLNLAGNNYGKEISTYTPEEVRNTEFDLSIAETLSTPALRMASNEFLMELFLFRENIARNASAKRSLSFRRQTAASYPSKSSRIDTTKHRTANLDNRFILIETETESQADSVSEL